MDAIWYGIEAIFKVLFDLLPYLGNLPNVLFIVIIFLLLCYWIYYSVKVEKSKDENYLSR
jgi:hypothetical protein